MINEKAKFHDNIFAVHSEMILGMGEDFYMISSKGQYDLLGVCDGCGGLGSRKYPEYGNKSGAYISSRVASEAVLGWFNNFAVAENQDLGNITDKICEEIKNIIVLSLADYKRNVSESLIKGSMAKSFPTTIALALTEMTQNGRETAYIWAGDSRGYLLSPTGLVQITKDDIKTEGDALSNIKDDGSLSNFISSDGDFRLNCRVVNCQNEGILITATDGCFDYFKTPMEFEFMLLHTMKKANSTEKWQENIKKYMRPYASDDYTICFDIFGYKKFKDLKKEYSNRLDFLESRYIKKLKLVDVEKLWSEYKTGYYGDV